MGSEENPLILCRCRPRSSESNLRDLTEVGKVEICRAIASLEKSLTELDRGHFHANFCHEKLDEILNISCDMKIKTNNWTTKKKRTREEKEVSVGMLKKKLMKL